MAASDLDPRAELEALVERSRRLGADTALVVHGGGNTSTKTVEHDHLGRRRDVLRIKGSGTDLRTIGADGFPGLYLDELLPLRERAAMTDEEMVDYLARCMIDPAARRPSIETLLHAFLPASHVDHVHADAIVTLTNTADGEKHVRAALGDAIAYVPFVRPGFALSKLVADLGDHEAVVLAHHGLVTWGQSHEESERRTVDLVARADDYLAAQRSTSPPAVAHTGAELRDDEIEALLLSLRGRQSRNRRRILSVDSSQRDVSDRADVQTIAQAGPATADHLLRTRTSSAVVLDRADPGAAIDAWEAAYRDYFQANKDRLPAGYDMLEPLPSVVLVPGLGAVTAGADKRSATVVAEVASHTHRVAAAAIDSFGDVERLSEQDLFDVDYWPLELYKLSLAPKPAELAGRIIIVTGAASGIGRTVAIDLASRGAHLVLCDLDEPGLEETVELLTEAADAVAAHPGDLADADTVDRAVSTAIRTFGGLDGIVSNAGIPATGNLVDLTPEQWRRSMDINATSHFLLTRRALDVLTRQGLGGSLVYVASKNAFGPGAGFGAYSAAKAAQVQLARIAALEGGAHGIRANVVNPDAVFDGSKLWSLQVRAERAAAHGVAPDELEDFYAQRNLLRSRVTTQDVAESVAFLLSDRSARTTGCVVTVDGGVAAAFPR